MYLTESMNQLIFISETFLIERTITFIPKRIRACKEHELTGNLRGIKMLERKRLHRASMIEPSQTAIHYITTCCRGIGGFSGSTDVHMFLKQVASEMRASQSSMVFPSCYIEHVAYAIDMVGSNQFTSPLAAIASVYLVTRFEFYFCVMSGKLNADRT